MTTPTWLANRMTKPCKAFTRVEDTRDEYGNVLYAEVETDTVCYMQPVFLEEIQEGRALVGDFLVHLPASVAGLVDGFGRIEVDGVSYEIQGPPGVYRSLTQPGVHHVELTVQRSSA